MEGSTTSVITQQRGAQTTRFSLISENELEIEVSSRRAAETYRINLKEVSEKASRQSFKAGAVDAHTFLAASVAFILLISGFLALSGEFPNLAKFFVLTSIPFIALTIRQIKKLRATSFDVFIYLFRVGGRAFVMEASKPNKEKVDEFRSKLELAICNSSPRENSLLEGDGLSSRIAKLHDLFKRGILNEDEFVSAKSRILTENKERVIGFTAEV